ncbi:MAG: helix-turn-helix transcriptional regulator [Lachnospiraceae bacterium]
MDLKNIRRKANLTQLGLADMCGCGRTTICMIENGKLKPSVKLAKKIGKALNFDWTLFYEDQKKNKGA